MKVYLAGPFFNPKQLAAIQKIEDLLAKFPIFEVFSPRKVGGVLKDMAPAERESALGLVFHSNVHGICGADLVLAVIDDRDLGTVWEIGYAHAMTNFFREVSIATYTDHDYGLNVMIQKCVDAHCRGMVQLETFLSYVSTGGAEAWTKFKNFNPQVT